MARQPGSIPTELIYENGDYDTQTQLSLTAASSIPPELL